MSEESAECDVTKCEDKFGLFSLLRFGKVWNWILCVAKMEEKSMK